MALPKNVTLKLSGNDAMMAMAAIREFGKVIRAHRSSNPNSLEDALRSANAAGTFAMSDTERVSNYIETVINAEKN